MREILSNFGSIRVLNVHGDGTYVNVLKELGDYSVKEGLAIEGISEALINRENEFPTGLDTNGGVAIAHTDISYTKKPAIILANLEKSAIFRSMVEKKEIDVRTVFLLLIKEAGHQVKILESIVDIIQDENKMKNLKLADNDEILKGYFV